jgi:hypothetical protein
VSIVGTYGKRIGPRAILSLDLKICTLRPAHEKPVHHRGASNLRLTHLRDPPVLGEGTAYDSGIDLQWSWESYILAGRRVLCSGRGIGDDGVHVLAAA